MNRFYAMWLYALTLVALTAAAGQSYLEERRWLADANSRSSVIALTIEEAGRGNLTPRNVPHLGRIVDRVREKQGITGAVLCNLQGTAPELSFPRGAGWENLCANPIVAKAEALGHDVHAWASNAGTSGTRNGTGSSRSSRLQYFVHPFDSVPLITHSSVTKAASSSANRSVTAQVRRPAVLLLIQDLSRLHSQWLASFTRVFAAVWLAGLALLLIVAAQARSWVKNHLKIIHRSLRHLTLGAALGRNPNAIDLPSAPEMQPISKDLQQLAAKIRSLATARAAKGAPAEDSWLTSLRDAMVGKNLVVVANREPYIHQKKDGGIEVLRPASGLVTALEPILRKCGGLWVAHGSGSGDAETVDAQNEVAVPPGKPSYKLRRVWMTAEEEQGYYYGFSNEGLWPLCHLAHTRPTFRLSDWERYRQINQRFGEALPETSLGAESLVLVQDYHFALLPRIIKERALAQRQKAGRRPSVSGSIQTTPPATPLHQDAANAPKVGVFWHIPWPNPEAFGICPWNRELLRGMLGADVIGFHTQYHCNNFLETCNRYLEARIDYEHFSVTMENHETLIRAFPIGIDTAPVRYLEDEEREKLKARYGIQAEFIAVGVDRLDYTKGLVERVEAVERFLEKHPEWIGRFTLVQMGAPSRSQIPAYRIFVENLEKTVARVNAKFSRAGASPPIVFLGTHHDWDDIKYFYQLGDLCMVTSLHDGMNLVAKEYVWCQKPERGSLLLSKFTGASRELGEAFVVNPYSIEEMADAIAAAVALSPAERAQRMNAMKQKVESHNAYHWASDLIRALVKKGESAVATPVADPELSATHPDLGFTEPGIRLAERRDGPSLGNFGKL